MTVGEMIFILSKFEDDTEVIITDGYKGNCYRGAYEVLPYVDDNGKLTVDIGIGGCDEE